MKSKVMTAVCINLRASEYIKDLFMAEVTCRSFSLCLFNLILVVLHLSFLTLFLFHLALSGQLESISAYDIAFMSPLVSVYTAV